MTEDIGVQYKVDDILASIPSDRGELFIGYRPASETDKWREHFHQNLDRGQGRLLSRSVLEVRGRPDGGVVVEVAECATAREAVEDLMETLAENQAAELDPGPQALRPAAFRNPEQAPAALFFARGNLRISIIAQSRISEGVDEWLDLIQHDLDLAPEDAREGLDLRAERGADVTRLTYQPRWKVGAGGWLKFVSDGVSLERGKEPGDLILVPAGKKATVRGWILERGRESYMGVFRSP